MRILVSIKSFKDFCFEVVKAFPAPGCVHTEDPCCPVFSHDGCQRCAKEWEDEQNDP